MKFKVVYIIFLFISLSTTAQKSIDSVLKLFNTESVPYISVEELRMLQLNNDVVILDARELKEFEVSKIPTATYVGFSEFSSEKISEEIIDKSKTVVVYCTLGLRSEEIGEKLLKEGFTHIKNLYGGIIEWKNKGFPVLDIANNETENVHVSSKFWGKWLINGVKVYE